MDGEVPLAMKMNQIVTYIFIVITLSLQSSGGVQAGTRFTSSYSCSDAVKTCVSSGIRKVDGFDVHRDCWEWGYVKTCNYPSKNDCRLYTHCYAVGDLGCLLQDSLGSCVNLQREFSCKSWDVVNKENKTVRMGFEAKDGKDGLVCKGIPCIDGNCVDKGYQTNGEMMDSLSKLYATSNMNPDKDGNFNLFAGDGQHCAKKPVGYSNCCQIDGKGWGKNLGVKCTKDEQTLIDMRSKKLCVYVGKQSSKKMGVTTAIKHRFCCFGNLLDKVIQVGARKQLGRSFGSGSAPDCQGLTLEDIQAIDWNLVDFGEFIEDLKLKFAQDYKAPNVGELASTVEVSMESIRKYDDDPSNQANNMSGWNGNVRDDSSEADEERRLEAERLERERLARLEQERLAQLERERLEQERLAKIEAERKIARKKEIDIELVPLRKKEQELLSIIFQCSSVQMNNRNWPVPPEYIEAVKKSQETSPKLDLIRKQIKVLENELKELK